MFNSFTVRLQLAVLIFIIFCHASHAKDEIVVVVPVSPIPSRVLHVVVEDELIYRRNHVEIPLPWNIVGLRYGNFFRHKNISPFYPANISK